MPCVKFGWNRPGGSGREDENVKSLQTDWRMTGNQEISQTTFTSLVSEQLTDFYIKLSIPDTGTEHLYI